MTSKEASYLNLCLYFREHLLSVLLLWKEEFFFHRCSPENNHGYGAIREASEELSQALVQFPQPPSDRLKTREITNNLR